MTENTEVMNNPLSPPTIICVASYDPATCWPKLLTVLASCKCNIKEILFCAHSFSKWKPDELTKDKYLFFSTDMTKDGREFTAFKKLQNQVDSTASAHKDSSILFLNDTSFSEVNRRKLIYCLTSSMKKPFRAHIESPKVIHHINSKPLYHYCRSNIIQLSHYKHLSRIYFSIPIRKFDVFNRSFIGPFGLFLNRSKIVSESYKQWITCWMTAQDNPQYTQHWHDAEKLTPENFIYQVNKSYAILIEHLAFRNIAVTEIEAINNLS